MILLPDEVYQFMTVGNTKEEKSRFSYCLGKKQPFMHKVIKKAKSNSFRQFKIKTYINSMYKLSEMDNTG